MSAQEFRPIQVEIDGVRLVWCGGRLADVVMPTRYIPAPHAVDCVQVSEWDLERDCLLREPTPPSLRGRLLVWMRDSYATFWENA